MKTYIINGRRLIATIMVVVLAAVVVGLNFDTVTRIVDVAAPKRDLPIYCTQQEKKVASLSFDAAWGA